MRERKRKTKRERVRESETERGRERKRERGNGAEARWPGRGAEDAKNHTDKSKQTTRKLSSTAPAALTEIENDMKDRWFTDHVSERMRNKALFLCQQKKSSSKFGNLASGQPVSHRRFRNFRLPSGQPVRQKWIT